VLAAPKAPPNLEEVTLDLQVRPDVLASGAPGRGQLGCKLTVYEDGVRATFWRAPEWKRSGSVEDVEQSSGGSGGAGSMDEKSRSAASIARSRRIVVHRARCLGVHSMWTFTKRGKFASADDVWAAWRRFGQMMRRRYREKWRYVAVPELHGDGATWHLHVLFGDFYMVETLRRLWYRALGGTGSETGEATPGSVNVKSLRSAHSTPRGAAYYVAKYVGKGFERGGSNRRVFATSLGLNPIEVTRWNNPYDDGIVEFVDTVGGWLGLLNPLARIFPRFFFRGRGGLESAVIDTAEVRAWRPALAY
jgi:hypothetical protein